MKRKDKVYVVNVYSLTEVRVKAKSKREALRIAGSVPLLGERVDQWVCPAVRIE